MKQKQIKCPYCHAHASLRPASLVYGATPQARGKYLYVCDRWPVCNAYVSAHERTLLPMGTLANGDLRHKRILAHRALKKLQQDCQIKHKYFDEAVPYIDAAVKQTKRLKQISDAAFQRQDIDEIESLALALRKEIEAALQPFYMGHMCLYVTPECFDDPPKTPEIYNDATACVWRDGTWQLLEDTSKGFLLFVQSKSKEESAA